MEIAPVKAEWPVLAGFYTKLQQELHAHGVGSLTTGGTACVLYKLAQMTKVCDIIIPIARIEVVLQVLAATHLAGHGCHRTLKYGAPLHERWLNGGWSSHTYFDPVESPMARVDFFGKPPRVTKIQADENPLYLSRDGLARMKKTRREKDWAFANLLGHQMLQKGDPSGLLHITDAERLVKVVRENGVNAVLTQERPLLKLAVTGDPQVERYIKAEKDFWSNLDHLRLTAYEQAWEPYGARINKAPHAFEMSLLEQNQALIAVAEQTLEPAPLLKIGWENLVNQAKEKTARIFQNLDPSLLPTPKAFPEENDSLNLEP